MSLVVCFLCFLFALEDETLGQRASRIVEFANRASLAGRPACVSRNRGEPVWRRVSFLLTLSPACLPLSLSHPFSLTRSLSPSLPFFRTLTHSLAHSVAFSLVFAPVHSLLSFSPADAFCFFSLAHSFAFFPFSHTHAYIYTHRAYTSFLSFSLPFDRLLSFSVCLPSRLTYRLRLSRLSGQRPFHDTLAPSALLFHSTLLRRATSCHLRAPVRHRECRPFVHSRATTRTRSASV